jgi:type IV pilus assembly protein PilW
MNTNSHKQQGMSLLSLMVAVAIGIFLVGAILKIYIDSKNTFNVRNVVAAVYENQRFALDDMRRILIMTGRDIRKLEDEFPNRRPFPAVATGGIVDGGASSSDIVAIRYRRGPSCGSYQAVGMSARPTMVRFLVNNNKELICEMTTYAGGTATTVQRTLVSGIEMLKILYGVDNNGDGYTDSYLTASQMGSFTPASGATSWAAVTTMRIGIVSSSDEELPVNVRPSTIAAPTILGMQYPGTMETSRIYRVASTTISLRNISNGLERE